MTKRESEVIIRNTTPRDFDGIIELTRVIYPESSPWTEKQLASHLKVFPEGQFVAIDRDTGRVVGMAASLIIVWDDYEIRANWREFTGAGMFTNHDPAHGRTLYGADVMVAPDQQGRGIGKLLYVARRELVERLGLLRIRAGARLRNYHLYAQWMSAEEYVRKILKGDVGDPTLSFQLRRGFHVLAVVPNYLNYDPESMGYAAVIEWINEKAARPEDYAGRNKNFIV